jgi:hypothetical protein
VYVGHDVAAVDLKDGVARRPQRRVQHCAVFGDVNLVAAEHRRPLLCQIARLGELDEQGQRLRSDTVLREVENETAALRREPLGALRVLGEQRAQIAILDRAVVRGERAPRNARRQRRLDRVMAQVSHPMPALCSWRRST